MKGSFCTYLKRAGHVSGPSRKATRHSNLSLIKDWLLGKAVTFEYKAHNNFGRAIHLRFLLRKEGRFKLTQDERQRINLMMASLDSHPVVRKIMSLCPIREKRRPCVLNGVKVNFTPDAHGVIVMADLKSTVCRTLKEFITKAIEYGYFRQGYQYSVAVGVKEYWIIGIQKQSPYKVFLTPLHDHKGILEYVKRELEFLLYFYLNYGDPNYKRKKTA